MIKKAPMQYNLKVKYIGASCVYKFFCRDYLLPPPPPPDLPPPPPPPDDLPPPLDAGELYDLDGVTLWLRVL